MGRVVRSLMKVPAVRRVMLRLANAEAAISDQRAQLGQLDALLQRLSVDGVDHRTLLAQISEHMPPARRASLEAAMAQQQAQLGHVNEHIRRLMADGADQRALLAEVAEHMPPVRLKQLEATIVEQHALLAEVAMHMPPARQAELEAAIEGQEATIREQEAAIKGQEAQIGALNQRVQQLNVDHDSQRELLAEVSQQLPPAQRANLEATLHGQQLQLGALNSTIHANQVQLGALNDIVQRLSAENASQRTLLAEVSAQVPPAHWASLETTIAELKTQFADLNNLVPRLAVDEAAHRARVEMMRRRVATPYTFEQLLNRQIEKSGVDLAVNIHIPKACGNTTNALFRQMGFLPISLDMNSNDFFHTVREDRWLEGYLAPPPRESYFLTGHLRLDHPIFRRIMTPYVVVTVLRDPIERILSHYNFTTRTPGSPWYDEVTTKGMSFLDYAANIYAAIGPQYGFFDDTGKGTFAPTGTATPERCFNNLTTSIGFYGLTDRFDEFAILSGYLLHRPEILSATRENVTKNLPDLNGIPLKTSLSKGERNAIK